MPFEVNGHNAFVKHLDAQQLMDQRGLSSIFSSSMASSFFSEEICYPAERQVGVWKAEHVSNHQKEGVRGVSIISGSKPAVCSSLDKFRAVGPHSVGCLDFPQPYLFNDHKTKLTIERHTVDTERNANLSMPSWRALDRHTEMKSNACGQAASLFVEGNTVDMNHNKYANGFFSSSFSEIFKNKLRLSPGDALFGQSIDTVNSYFEEDEPFESLKEIEAQTIGDLLPDDDDFLSGLIDEFDCIAQPNSGDDVEDFDLFSSGGGLELEGDDSLSCHGGNISLDLVGGISNGQQGGSSNSFGGEHPYGEHPSRTLFVRNINSNVEDSELRDLFEQYGDIRTLYTACKHRGFVMISYYDIRAARNAMRALQNKPLRHRKLDIHFSIPKDNPSEKDINQGTLVVFNLDSSVSNDELRQIFGVYGEIKEIRETPHKRHHKFIEFFDVRAAETALRALNRSDIAGKRIKLEPSRPGGARRLMQQLSPELEQEEFGIFCQQGSPVNDSPPGCYGSLPCRTISSGDNTAILGLPPATRPPLRPFMDTTFHVISPNAPYGLSSPIRVASVGNPGNQSGFSEGSHSLGQSKFSFPCIPNFHPHSLPEYHNGIGNDIPYNSPSTTSALPANINSRPADGMENRNIHRVCSSGFTSHSFDHNEVFGNSRYVNLPLHRHHYIFSNPSSYQPHPPNPMVWPNSPSFMNGVPAHPRQFHALPRATQQMSTVLPLHHHPVGSAPAMNPSFWDHQHAYAADPTEASAFHLGSLGSMGFPGSSTPHPLELAAHNMFAHVGGNCVDLTIPSTNVGVPSPQQRCPMFPSRNPMIPLPASFDSPSERVRGRRNEANSGQADNKKQFELDVDCILRGQDSRTTLMIKNIPNKYTSKMLLAAIDEHHRGTYDFIYLPIDFKNKCNVGYAFINMIDPLQIVPFFQAFNGKKWEKFNSEKVASLAYARIQGKAALIAHFQNSSLMNEDKRCRPILFHSGGPNAGDQEPFPTGINIRLRPSKPRTSSNEDNHEGSPSTSTIGDDSSNGTGSYADSSKDISSDRAASQGS